MPVVLIPIHFDRDPSKQLPSCQRSVVIRTFITNDFMTGIPATPGKHISVKVSNKAEFVFNETIFFFNIWNP